MEHPKRIIVGITGASGAAYAQRLIRLLLTAGVQTHLIVSPMGQRLVRDELGIDIADLASPAPLLSEELRGAGEGADIASAGALIHHRYKDVGASVASGSFRHDGMIVIPCSSNTLAAVATGSSDNLLHRAAHVTLKERRRLVLVHREMPLSLIDIRNMERVAEAGGIIAPASPGFYLMPQNIDDLVDFVVGRCLDLLDVPHDLNIRWTQSQGTENEGRDR